MVSLFNRFLRADEAPAAEFVIQVRAQPILRSNDPDVDTANALATSVGHPVQSNHHVNLTRPNVDVVEVLTEAIEIQLRARDNAVQYGCHVVVGVATSTADFPQLLTGAGCGQVLATQEVHELAGTKMDAAYEWKSSGRRQRRRWELIFDDRSSRLDVPFERVFASEIDGWVRQRRTADRKVVSRFRPAVGNNLYGLALSGGGMRAGVFSLGVVQGLAKARLLSGIDYLSSVSGGGYLGASLAGLASQELPYRGLCRFNGEPERFPFGYPRPGSGVSAPDAAVHGEESPALWHVRKHAQLLGRGVGLFDYQTWQTVGRYLVSTLALWVLFPLPTIVLLALLGVGAWHVAGVAGLSWWLYWTPFLLAGLLLVGSVALGLMTRRGSNQPRHKHDRWVRRGEQWGRIAVVGVVASLIAWLIGLGVWALDGPDQRTLGAFAGGATGGGGMLAIGFRRLWAAEHVQTMATKLLVVLGGYLVLGLGMVTVCWAVWRLVTLEPEQGDFSVDWDRWMILAFGAVVIFRLGAQFSPAKLLNWLSLGDVYRNRIQETWIITASPDGEQPVALPRWSKVWPGRSLTMTTLKDGAPQAPLEGSPYPLFCATLNLPGSQGDKLPERKGDSFVIAPFFSGSALTRWAPTGEEADFKEMSLAQAAAISGAAVASNMGEKTTPTLSIIATLFNARLGRWVPNPRGRDRSRIVPHQSAWSLYLKEMFAKASRDDEVVYVSDGGHFENLGVYELFRRRCRYIVAVSADVEDPAAEDKMGNLGNALRMARVDFGVEVKFDGLDTILRNKESGRVRSSFTVGELRYGNSEEKGVFVLIKTGLPERDLPPDLLEYSRSHPAFPYDSTSDQQFGQPQFESYRQLGYLAALAVDARSGDRKLPIGERFDELLRTEPAEFVEEAVRPMARGGAPPGPRDGEARVPVGGGGPQASEDAPSSPAEPSDGVS